ncbi:MAG: glycosyltransferase family 4 protein [Elusimicrobiota bacterium]
MKLKICMLLARFYPIIGGTELQAQRLSGALVDMENDIFILTARLKGLKKYEVINGLPIHRTFILGRDSISSFFFCISSFIFLLKNSKKYDIIHVHLASSHAFSAILIKKLFGKKIILKFGGARKTGDIETSISKPCGKLKLKIIKKSFDIFVVPGNEVLAEIISAGFPKEKTFLIPNGVNTSIFRPVDIEEKTTLRKKLNIPTDCPICIYAGRIEQGKGLDALLNIWEKIPGNMHLLIVGEGSLLKNFRSSFTQKNIHFLGFQKNINEFLSASDAFILSSFGEGLSNAILEAMSSGLIVLANNIRSNADIITDNYDGLLLNFESTFAVAESTLPAVVILKICASLKTYSNLGIQARQTVIEKYSLPYIANRYAQLYEKCLTEIQK